MDNKIQSRNRFVIDLFMLCCAHPCDVLCRAARWPDRSPLGSLARARWHL